MVGKGGRGGRGPSGPWSRLKPVNEDPLDSMGLPSRGDNRLLEFKAQEKYYTKIMERYMTFCSSAGERDELLRRFASLDITGGGKAGTSSGYSKTTGAAASGSIPRSILLPPPTPTAETTKPEDTKSLSSVLGALRKLREGIVGSKRADEFSTQAYLFCIRLGVLVKQPEAYHPAIQHLLRSIHPLQPLTPVELTEVVGYLVLDAACRRGDLAEAFATRTRWRLRDKKVEDVLRALVHDDFVGFARLKRRVDGHKARLMEWAEEGVRRHALKCLGKGYLSVDRGFLERVTGREWEVLRKEDGVGWELEGNGEGEDGMAQKVVIRRVGRKCVR
ncbi:hypothetical protein MKZ38_001398 [Zalerion maritima]|uniref:Uncharacterized protein n=1 Tax=Zalerion maritima TaxID=339359 RepID=A0AAD5WRI2_9PEZI|nr:hypothetical protein MKZ38_001398 [Zalerion maritima]